VFGQRGKAGSNERRKEVEKFGPQFAGVDREHGLQLDFPDVELK
jgi:hypothetical protein